MNNTHGADGIAVGTHIYDDPKEKEETQKNKTKQNKTEMRDIQN